MAEVSFGGWLKRRRGAEGWTQGQLAQKINCSTSALRKMESEERRPSAQIVEQLAEIFNIPREERKAFLRFTRGDWQAISSGNQEESPWRDPRVRTPPRSNLPASTTSFIGREKELDEIVHLVAKDRLVTLAGAGGIGKTRLSLKAAQELLNAFADGVWFIELAPLSDPTLVPQAMVSTLGLIDQAGRSALNVLTDFLQTKHALLILDNCEHLIQTCAQLAETLLHACPNLHLIATSREALGVPGEITFSVPALSVPEIEQSFVIETLTKYEAVQLFIERARAALPGFVLTRDNVPAIAQVCHQLDGIPLALELAAARIKMMSLEEIRSHLNDRFRLLTGGARTALPRHQTLQAMIDWSHDLLSEPERVLWRRLSIFAGGWSLKAAESICGNEGIETHEILDLLTQLLNKSLLIAEQEQGKETRYHMLETIRQYARDKLWTAGEGAMMRQRHLAYFVDLAERAEPNLRAFDMVIWLDRLETEQDNIRVAMEWALESDVEAELRLASALWW
ncbi:MAG TPA: helix-turn-helix domain-containing protein, partial [Anaerolineales bacterium]